MKLEAYLIILSIVILIAAGVFYIAKQTDSSQKATADKESGQLNLSGDNKSVNIKNNQSTITTMPQQPQNKTLSPPTMEIDQNKTYTAVLSTTAGEISIELNAKQTPKTVNNFIYLAKQGFYDGVIFHRVIRGFMIQGGDPTGTGAGGPGYQFADEPFEGDYTRGTVAMANAGHNTNGSQFFIMHGDQPLPKNYVIFGKVVAGMETVDKIAQAEVIASGSGEPSKPVDPVKIVSVKFTE